jgi:hypothetical protein
MFGQRGLSRRDINPERETRLPGTALGETVSCGQTLIVIREMDRTAYLLPMGVRLEVEVVYPELVQLRTLDYVPGMAAWNGKLNVRASHYAAEYSELATDMSIEQQRDAQMEIYFRSI